VFWVVIPPLLFEAIVVPLIFLGSGETGGARLDFYNYHRYIIQYFIDHPFAVAGYPQYSSPAPGHHLFFGALAWLLGISEVGPSLRVLSSLLGCLLGILLWTTMRLVGASARQATSLTLPAILSPYVLSSADWMATDHGAIVLYAGALLSLVAKGGPLCFGILMMVLVCWRQIYLPIAAVYSVPLALQFLEDGRRLRSSQLRATVFAVAPAIL
jgi:hypothetical protein